MRQQVFAVVERRKTFRTQRFIRTSPGGKFPCRKFEISTEISSDYFMPLCVRMQGRLVGHILYLVTFQVMSNFACCEMVRCLYTMLSEF